MTNKQLIEHIYNSPQEEIAALKAYIEKLEDNKVKLLDSLMTKERKDKEHYCYLPESALSNFFTYDKCNQRLLALLYWDKLSKQQKHVFTDYEEMEIEKSLDKKMQEIMSNPTKLKQHFLRAAGPVMENILAYANGTRKVNGADQFYVREVWEVLKAIIESANTPAPLISLRGKDVSAQIDEILTQVTAGEITFDDAKEYMSLVSSGFNLQELPKLMSKLESLESM